MVSTRSGIGPVRAIYHSKPLQPSPVASPHTHALVITSIPVSLINSTTCLTAWLAPQLLVFTHIPSSSHPCPSSLPGSPSYAHAARDGKSSRPLTQMLAGTTNPAHPSPKCCHQRRIQPPPSLRALEWSVSLWLPSDERPFPPYILISRTTPYPLTCTFNLSPSVLTLRALPSSSFPWIAQHGQAFQWSHSSVVRTL